MHRDAPPESVVQEASAYRFSDQAYAANPWDLWKRFRETDGLLRSDQDGGFWILSRYDEVRRVATHDAVFCARMGRVLPPYPQRLLPADADGSDHKEYRRVLNPWMTRGAMEYMEPAVRSFCRERLEPLIARAEFDIAQDYLTPVILMCGLEWLGWPVEDWSKFGAWAHDILLPATEADLVRGWTSLSEFVMGDIERRRRAGPADGVINAIINAEVHGRPITDDEALQLIISIHLGSIDTTASTLSAAFHYLAHHPDERDWLRANPDSLPSAVEEFLRIAGTVTYTVRTALEDAAVDGCPVKKGDRLALLTASASFDEKEFSHPEAVDLNRKPNRHMGFGAGPHKCVGAPFARMMLRVAIQEGLERLGDFQVADESRVKWATNAVRQCLSMPMTHSTA